jgi:hypothetical protein
MRHAFQNGFVTFLTKNATVGFLPCANAALDRAPVAAALPSATAPVAKLRRVIFMVSSLRSVSRRFPPLTWMFC